MIFDAKQLELLLSYFSKVITPHQCATAFSTHTNPFSHSMNTMHSPLVSASQITAPLNIQSPHSDHSIAHTNTHSHPHVVQLGIPSNERIPQGIPQGIHDCLHQSISDHSILFNSSPHISVSFSTDTPSITFTCSRCSQAWSFVSS